MDMWLSFMFAMGVFGVVLFLGYVTTKLVGGKAGKMMRGKNMNVVESISLGMDKQIHLVKVGEKFIVLSTSGKNIQMLTELSPEQMGEVVAENTTENQAQQFKEIFDKYVGGVGKRFSGAKKEYKKDKDVDYFSKDNKRISKNLQNIKAINKKLKKSFRDAEDEIVYENGS